MVRGSAGRVFGVEVKTSLVGVFRLDPKQVRFDALVVGKGAVTASTPIIRGVMYRGECFVCGTDGIYRSWKLINELRDKDVTFFVTQPPIR